MVQHADIDHTGLTGVGGAPDAHAASHEAGGSDEIDATGLTGVGGGELYGIGPADRAPGSPHASDDEFTTTDTSDPMTGWTTMGTPTSHNMNSTAPSHYYVTKAAGGVSLTGIYKASPSTPFTVTCKLSGSNIESVQGRAGLFVAVSPPGKVLSVARSQGQTVIATDIWTNPTSYSSTPSTATYTSTHLYLRMIVTSTTDVTTQFSFDGFSWFTLSTSLDPTMTIGAVGVMIDPHSVGITAAATFDWIRFS